MTRKSLRFDKDKKTLRWAAWALMMSLPLLVLILSSPDVKPQSGEPPVGTEAAVRNLSNCPIGLYGVDDRGTRTPLGRIAPQGQWDSELRLEGLSIEIPSGCAANGVPEELRLDIRLKGVSFEAGGAITVESSLVKVVLSKPENQ